MMAISNFESKVNRIKVAVVEDDKVLRESLKELLELNPQLHCVGTYANGIAFLDEFPVLSVDVVLMDISMPGISGIEAVKKATALNSSAQFLMHTVFDDDEKILQALKNGATGYLLKGASPSEIYEAILSIHAGGSPMTAVIARKVVSSFLASKHAYNQSQLLTEREMDITENLAKGLKYKEIADKLCISVDTVRTHIRNIYEKLQVNSKIEAINKVFPSDS